MVARCFEGEFVAEEGGEGEGSGGGGGGEADIAV